MRLSLALLAGLLLGSAALPASINPHASFFTKAAKHKTVKAKHHKAKKHQTK
jgi:hypothetical protein